MFRTSLRLGVVALGLLAGAAGADPPARAVTFEKLVEYLELGVPEDRLVEMLAKSPTKFTLSQEQLDRLKSAGAGSKVLQALSKKGMSSAANADVADFVLILDCSGSMNETVAGGTGTKFESIKASAIEVVDALPDGKRLAFIVYGNDTARKCESVEVLRPIAPIDSAGRSRLRQSITQLKAVGHTPIANALKKAGEELASGSGSSSVILLTDGMETCHGDPVDEAAALAASGRTTVNVVGIGLKEEESKAVGRIAEAGKGRYYDARSAAELRDSIQKVRAEVVLQKPEPEPESKPTSTAGKASGRVRLFIRQLKDANASVRGNAAEELAKLGDEALPAVPALQDLVAADEWGGRHAFWVSPEDPGKDGALKALNTIARDKVVEALVRIADAKSSDVKAWGALHLGDMPASVAKSETPNSRIRALIRLLADESSTVQGVAAETLAKLDDEALQAVPALQDLLKSSRWGGRHAFNISPEDPGRDGALAALKKLASGKVEDALIAAGESSNEDVRKWATMHLGKLSK